MKSNEKSKEKPEVPSRYKVLQMRAMAPDKAMLYTALDACYTLEKHDFTNLVDYTEQELRDLLSTGNTFILPADEGDIKFANTLSGVDQRFILLPHDVRGNVIDYDTYVEKSSSIYRSLEDNTGIIYPGYDLFDRDTWLTKMFTYIETQNEGKSSLIPFRVHKTTTGSGSRGVLLYHPYLMKYGGKYVDKYTIQDLVNLYEFAGSERCKIMVQKHIPFLEHNLKKVNVDFVMKDGRLLGYKWDITNQDQLFTNWDNLHIFRNEYTDFLMSQVAIYLTNRGIWDGILNFEAFSDMEDETWMVEFNWRYSNSMFEASAFNIDMIDCYLKGREFTIPMGSHKAVRYWGCKLYSDIDHVIGKNLN